MLHVLNVENFRIIYFSHKNLTIEVLKCAQKLTLVSAS